ncbi:MAG: hypothetical protein LBD20_04300 [Spirochaetaceae bacterium]|jgi:hypothetical protein|nr:hypothetical protein [Spirochaetaceae bacterium]
MLLLAAFGMGDTKKQEIVPAIELNRPEKGTQSVEEFVPPSETGAGFYKRFIAENHQAVN